MVALRTVLDQETLHAGELVGLGRQHHHVKLHVGEVLTR